MALGPVVGGVLVTSVGWRSIFWINIPIALAAVVLALRYIPESKAAVARRVDVPGQLLVIVIPHVADLRHHREPGKGMVLDDHHRRVRRRRWPRSLRSCSGSVGPPSR